MKMRIIKLAGLCGCIGMAIWLVGCGNVLPNIDFTEPTLSPVALYPSPDTSKNPSEQSGIIVTPPYATPNSSNGTASTEQPGDSSDPGMSFDPGISPTPAVTPSVAPGQSTSPASSNPVVTVAPASPSPVKPGVSPSPPKPSAAVSPSPPKASPSPPKASPSPPKASPSPTSVTTGTISADQLPSGSGGVKYIDVSTANQSYVTAAHTDTSQTLKFYYSFNKDANNAYSFKMGNTGKYEYFPLIYGSGTYDLSITAVTANGLRVIYRVQDVSVSITESVNAYKKSASPVLWNWDQDVTRKAKSLGSLEAIHDFIYKNYKYDYNFAAEVKAGMHSGYVPDAPTFYTKKKGICFDFANMLAVMSRSIGIPTRLVMGYSDLVNGYHAWNEVYVGGKWRVIDATVDACYWENGTAAAMYKDAVKYRKVLIF